MKKQLFFTLVAFVGVFLTLKAQDITLKEGTVSHNGKMRPCVEVHLSPEPDLIKPAFRDYMRKNHGVRMKGIGFLANRDLMDAEEVVIEKITSKTINFYALTVESKTGSVFKVFGSYGYDIYVGPEKDQLAFDAMKDIVRDFLKSFLPDYYKNSFRTAQKRVKSLEKEIDKQEKQMKRNKKEIKDLEDKNKDLEKSIEDDKKKLKEAEKIQENQEQRLREVNKKLESL